MLAAVLYEYGADLLVQEVDVAPPKDNEVLVKVAASGVCHSDLSAAKGKSRALLPLILGHEAAGIVEKVGSQVSKVKPGDHVILSWAPNCGHCYYCNKTLPVMCDRYAVAGNSGGLWDGTSRFGAGGKKLHHYSCVSSFAEYTVVPESGCIAIDRDVPFEVAALVGCAVTTGYGAVVNDAKVRPGDAVAVFGVGGVGVNAIQAAARSGAYPIIAFDIDAKKEAVARRYGAHEFIDPRDAHAVELVRQLTSGRGFDTAIECTGNPGAFTFGFESLRLGGSLVAVGIAGRNETITMPAAALPNTQKRMVGSLYGGGVPEIDIQNILKLYKAGQFDLESQVGQRIDLARINEAFTWLQHGVMARTVIMFA